MARNPVGKVLDRAGIREFSFVAAEYFQGDFIQVEVNYPKGKKVTVVGEIVNKEAINPYFEKPSTINYLADRDESIGSWSLYVAQVRPIVAIRDREIIKLDFPPAPGTNVYTADEDMVSFALGFERQGISIGFLKQLRNLKINISEAPLCRTHLSILGRTGSGKSFFAKGLMKRIRDRRLVIISPNEEYNEIAKDLDAQILFKEDLLLPLDTSYMASIYSLTLQEQILFEQFMKREKSLMEKAKISNQEIAQRFSSTVQSTYRRREQAILPGMEADSARLIAEDRVSRSPSTILSKIRSKSAFFSNEPMKVPFLKSTIIDMSQLEQESQEIVVMYILNNLLESYRNEKKRQSYPNLIVVIEEAHNFAPSVQTTACKSKVIQLAREGRKLGIALCLVTQRPRHFDQTVLSQCGSLFLFHIPHPEDVEHVFGTSPVYRRDLIDTVRELTVGECLILGDVVRYPLVCSVKF